MSETPSRRSFLAATLAVALGGCVGDGNENATADGGGAESDTDGGGAADETPTPDAASTATPTDTPTDTPTVTPTAESPEEMVERLPEPSPLAGSLVDLVLATDRETFADSRNLQYESGAVKVEISLVDGGTPPEKYLPSERTEYGQTVIAYVAVDLLVDLALHEDVQFVAAYMKPQPDR